MIYWKRWKQKKKKKNINKHSQFEIFLLFLGYYKYNVYFNPQKTCVFFKPNMYIMNVKILTSR